MTRQHLQEPKRYEVWQAGYRGWSLDSVRHVFKHRWQARLCAWRIRWSYPANSVYRNTDIRETND